MSSDTRAGRRRSTTCDHIAAVALDLFDARGFGAVSVDDVAEASGIARRTSSKSPIAASGIAVTRPS